MTAAEILEDLRRRGVTLVAEGDRLRFHPKTAVPPETRDLLARHKPELLALVRGNRPGYSPWPDRLPALGPRRVGPFTACALCERGTWARFGDTPLCLPCAQEADPERLARLAACAVAQVVSPDTRTPPHSEARLC